VILEAELRDRLEGGRDERRAVGRHFLIFLFVGALGGMGVVEGFEETSRAEVFLVEFVVALVGLGVLLVLFGEVERVVGVALLEHLFKGITAIL
jgi:hypothetical protein